MTKNGVFRNKADVFEWGRREGRCAARYCEVGRLDRREAQCACYRYLQTSTDWDIPECEECIRVAARESEENARSYSPWEFGASEINGMDEVEGEGASEELWEEYDRGVAAGIEEGIRERLGKGKEG